MKPRLGKTLKLPRRTPKRKARAKTQRRKEPAKKSINGFRENCNSFGGASFSLRKLCVFAPLRERLCFFCGESIFKRVLALAFLIGNFGIASAQQFSEIPNQIPVGTRPRSMGEAFVAVADDGNAMYWNPAGLAQLERIQANFAYADLFGLGINSFYAGFLTRVYFVPPLTDYLSFGVAGYGIHTREEELNPFTSRTEETLGFSQTQFLFSLAFRPPQKWPGLRHLSLGANAKYFEQTGRLNGRLEGAPSGPGADAGLLYDLGALPRVLNGLRFGLMIHDVGGTHVRHDNPDRRREKILPQNIRWGFSYRPFEFWPRDKAFITDPVLAFDVDDRLHFGLEFWLGRVMALRAGLQKDRHTDEPLTLSLGLGFKANVKDWPEASVDYTFTDAPGVLNTDRQFGGALVFKDNPRLIRIEEAHVEDVFASLYRHYGLQGQRVGYVKLKNVSEDTLKAWIDFQASRYMKPQAPDTVTIDPGRTLDFSLRAVFEPEILEAPSRRLNGAVTVTYEHQRSQSASRASVDFALHSQNYLTWEEPARAAAFVTPNDLLVSRFVEQARALPLDDSTTARWFTRYHLKEALVLYHALKAYNIDYRPDAVTPFPSVRDTLRGTHYRLDRVLYPRLFLNREKRFGDCDDLTVLYCSLLQNAGLPTALVSVPGHIFMMFDSGIPLADSLKFALPPALFVKRNGTLWIPVETTMIPSATFTKAWATAATNYAESQKEFSLEVVEVAAAQAVYPPAEWPYADGFHPAISDFSLPFERDLAMLEELKAQYVQSFVAGPETPARKNQYGVMLAENDEYDLAEKQFERIVSQQPPLDSTYAPAWNNWGNVEFILGRFERAEKLYRHAIRHNAFSRGTYLNLAMLYQMMKGEAKRDTVYCQRESEKMLLKAAQLLEGDSLAAHALLNLHRERNDTKAAPGLIEKIKTRMRKTREFVDRSFRLYVQKKEIRGVALDRHGSKGRGERDADRAVLLYWSF